MLKLYDDIKFVKYFMDLVLEINCELVKKICDYDISFLVIADDVEKDVLEHIKQLAPGGGYVCCSSHSIVDAIPPENFITMIEAVHKYGKY